MVSVAPPQEPPQDAAPRDLAPVAAVVITGMAAAWLGPGIDEDPAIDPGIPDVSAQVPGIARESEGHGDRGDEDAAVDPGIPDVSAQVPGISQESEGHGDVVSASQVRRRRWKKYAALGIVGQISTQQTEEEEAVSEGHRYHL